MMQFAGHGSYDHYAVCVKCKQRHIIAKGERIETQAWLDWLTKHSKPGCRTLVAAYGIDLNSFADNADVKEAFAASASFTLTAASLATSASLIVGRESTWISNASNKYLDELVAGKTMTSGTTNVTAGTQIELHAVGTVNDTPTYPDVFTGTDSGITLTAADAASIKTNICKPIAIMGVAVVTQAVSHPFGPVGIRQLFGDGLPTAYGLFLTQNTGQALHATSGNSAFSRTPVYNTVI